MNEQPKALTEYTLIEQETIIDELNKVLRNHLNDSYNSFCRYLDYNNTYEHKNIYFYVPFFNKFFFISTDHLLKDLAYKGPHESVGERLLNYSKNSIFSMNDLSDIRHGYYGGFSEMSVIFPEVIDLFREHNPYCAINEYLEYYLNKKENAMTYGWRWYRYNKPTENALLEYAVLYLQYPQIEQLVKCGLQEIVLNWANDSSPLYQRSFKKGNNINEITKLPKFAWQSLKNKGISDIKIWNELRVWIQKDNLTKDQLDTVLNLNITEAQTIKLIRGILNSEYDGKKLYTLDSLLNYLERVDMYQAINTNDSIVILRDYIRMALECGVKPLTDSNSLKREHDVVMRNYHILMKEKRQEFQDSLGECFADRGEELSKYEFSNTELIVISPKCIDDLIKEGSNNHNCVASYFENFAKGQSNIFFIRKKDAPDDSYITIELNSDFSKIKQAFYSSNREITNQNDLYFINSWIEHNKQINKSIEIEKEKDITDDMY